MALSITRFCLLYRHGISLNTYTRGVVHLKYFLSTSRQLRADTKEPTQYFDEAKDLGVSKENVWRYVYLQATRDMQKHHEMEIKEKEVEKEIAILIKDHNIHISNLKWKISFLTQRWALESFYKIFWEMLVDKKEIENKKIRPMSEIEQMTKHIKYRIYIDEIFQSVGITKLKIPARLPERLLYGRLSEMIHHPDVSKVFVMSDEDETFIDFMKAISKLLDMEVEEINAEEARSHDVEP